ncbi:MAG: protein kinase, partial [Acaryochloris sp. SU_5_25]|nr:protein kinase [Acaryochloris sp. SU_5_25]
MLGRTLGGRYQILETLGGGSFGQTYLAVDIHRPERPQCVVKHLKPAKRDPDFLPKARSLFEREAVMLEKLGSHDQIPRLLAYFEEKQEFYLVQEFIPGHLLRTELSQGCRWSEDQVVQLLQDILTILAFIHQFDVIHRDVKPENIIRRQQDNRLVLIDFGAVKQLRKDLSGDPYSSLPVGGTIAIGTPGYMAPEQAQGRPRTNSDLYALGMIGIEAFLGKNPTQFRQTAQGEIDWQEEVAINLGLADILQQMVRYHFQYRYPSAQAVLSDLQQRSQSSGWLQKVSKLLRSPLQTLWTSDPTSGSHGSVQTSVQGNPAVAFPGHSLEANALSADPDSATQRIEAITTIQVFISSLNREPELHVAKQLFAAIKAAGYQPFMATQSLELKENWAQHIDQALKACDYYLLLLSRASAHSELMLQELRAVKTLHQLRSHQRPKILPIRVDLPMDSSLNYELRGYLHRLQQRIWRTAADTPQLIQDLLATLAASDSIAKTLEQPSSGAFPSVPPLTPGSDAPPLPVAEPELPEGQVNVASGFYIERPPIETRCAETVMEPGALIRIKAPRQMGKTSLMARILHQAASRGLNTVSLNLQLADGKVFTDLDQLLRWLCASVSRRLRLPNRLQETWDDIFGSKYNCTAYFEEYLLTETEGPLTLALDEVDRVFEYPEIASDFFGLLRAWHEEAKNQEIWQKLRLIVVHATEVYIPLNTNQSPFNVGLPIDLPEFTLAQISQLADLHRLDWDESQTTQLQTLIGGHPYLIRLALYHLAKEDMG